MERLHILEIKGNTRQKKISKVLAAQDNSKHDVTIRPSDEGESGVQGGHAPTPTFSETVLCQGGFPGNLLLCHF